MSGRTLCLDQNNCSKIPSPVWKSKDKRDNDFLMPFNLCEILLFSFVTEGVKLSFRYLFLLLKVLLKIMCSFCYMTLFVWA